MALSIENAGKLLVDRVLELLVFRQYLMVDLIAVDHQPAQTADGVQRAGFPCSGAAGKTKNDPLAVGLQNVEPRRFFQTVVDCQAQTVVIRALGENFGHAGAVEGPERVEQTLGLNLLIPAGSQWMHLVSRKPPGVLVEADHAGGRAKPAFDFPRGGFRRAGDYGDGGFGA